jgi:hypothetical protein
VVRTRPSYSPRPHCHTIITSHNGKRPLERRQRRLGEVPLNLSLQTEDPAPRMGSHAQ